MSRPLLVSPVLLFLLCPRPLPAQELPELTPERRKLVDLLLETCVKDGGVESARSPDGKTRLLRAVSPEKIQKTLAGRKEWLESETREALAAFWPATDEQSELPILAILDAYGTAAKDEYANGLSAFLRATRAVREIRPDHAATSYKRAVQHFDAAGQQSWTALSLDNLGRILGSQGMLVETTDCYKHALAVRRRLYSGPRFPDGHAQLARSLDNLGLALEKQGSFEEAVGFLKLGLEMRRKLYPRNEFPDGHHELAASLHGLGLVFRSHGSFAEAADYLDQALKMRRQLYPSPIFPLGHPDLAACLDDLGSVLFAQGEYAEAVEHYRQALDMRRPIYTPARFPTGHPDVAMSLNHLGTVLASQGSHATALEFSNQAVQSMRTAPPLVPLETGPAAASQLKPRPDTAEFLRNRAAILVRTLPDHAPVTRLHEAERAIALATAMYDRLHREVLHHDTDKLNQGERADWLLASRIGLLERLFEAEHHVEHLRNAVEAVEAGRARVFLESLGQANAVHLSGLPSELREEEEGLRRNIRLIDASYRAVENVPGEASATKQRELRQKRQQAEDALLQFERKLAESKPEYAALRFPRPCKLEDARKALTDNEVALLFAVGEESSYAIVVQARPRDRDPRDGIAIVHLPGRKILAEKVTAVSQPERLQRVGGIRALAVELYGLLFKKLEKLIGDKDLVIVPDGPLGYLPFELLVEGGADGGRYLIQNRRIRYAPSLTALHMIRLWEEKREKQPDRPLFALGDPDFGAAQVSVASRGELREVGVREGRGDRTFTRLKASGDEVRALGQLFGTANAVLTGDRATEAAVKKASTDRELVRYRYIHFATHGILGVDHNEPPALVLSLVGTTGKEDEFGRDDGFLRLPEVSALKLNADLVVLSACRTGQGRMHNGEGVSGLARVFLYAGTRGVVCSLWSVDDGATSELMQSMYKRLKDGQPTAEALREAKLAMIRDDQPPFFWAPFIHIGR